MSLLLRDKLCIALSPDQVAMLQLGRGVRPHVASRREVPCEHSLPGEAPWTKPLDRLATGLRPPQGGKIDAMVVLSNHFVRYALVPWSDQISDKKEEQAFIRHCFAQTYGADAQHWAVRLSPNGYGETQVASAIDQGLLDGLVRVAKTNGLRLASLQPYFMTVFNQWRHLLQGAAVWFVVAEPGRLCLSQLQRGRWTSLRTVKVGAAWQEALQKLLEREFLVSDSGTERGHVYLHAPDVDSETTLSGWTVHLLKAAPDAAPDSRLYFSMAASE